MQVTIQKWIHNSMNFHNVTMSKFSFLFSHFYRHIKIFKGMYDLLESDKKITELHPFEIDSQQNTFWEKWS